MQFLKSKKCALNDILLLTFLHFFISYIQHNAAKQPHENHHVLLANPVEYKMQNDSFRYTPMSRR